MRVRGVGEAKENGKGEVVEELVGGHGESSLGVFYTCVALCSFLSSHPHLNISKNAWFLAPAILFLCICMRWRRFTDVGQIYC